MGTVHMIPSGVINDVVERLAANAESVCRRYLPNGRRQGHYWLIGDVQGSPGRSLYVRLKPSGKGAAGKWTDYVALLVMLPRCAWAGFCVGSADSAQHNLLPFGSIA